MFRGGTAEVPSIQSREDAELVEEEGTCFFLKMPNLTKKKCLGTLASPCDKLWIISSRADVGGENCYYVEEEEHLCGRRSQIHDVRQSEDRIRPQRG